MLKRLAPIALLVCSCLAPGMPGPNWPRGFLFMDSQPGVAFRTSCGLQVLNHFPYDKPEALPEEWNLGEVQALEDRAIAAYETLGGSVLDRRFDVGNPCAVLYGWTVYVVNSKNFPNTSGQPIGGETSCSMGRIFIGNSPPVVGRLAHELGHAIQNCDPGGDGKVYFDQHYKWEPIYAALKAAGLPE